MRILAFNKINMQKIAESELIINNRGAIYHLDCRPEEIASTIITVGDPDRVKTVSKHFDTIEFKNQHREFITHTGYIGNKRISCVSTGIGPDNIDIVFNELDALVNIDFEKRQTKEQLTALNIIRLGTSGSLQESIPVDSFVVSTHGLGLDNLLHFYQLKNNAEEQQLLQAFTIHTQLSNSNIIPYIYEAGSSLLKLFTTNYHHGITVTCPGFFGPQGRVLRLGLAYPNLVDNLTSFKFKQQQVTNFEMETSAMFGLARAMGHNSISISAIVANRVKKEFSANGNKAVEKLIAQSLAVIADSNI